MGSYVRHTHARRDDTCKGVFSRVIPVPGVRVGGRTDLTELSGTGIEVVPNFVLRLSLIHI